MTVRMTDRAWWSVEDASALLRVNVHTLYRAVAADDFPHMRVGPFIKIPAEALGLMVDPLTKTRPHHLEDVQQLALPLDVSCLVPVRRYRNGDIRKVGDYETSLSRKKWRNQK